MSAGLGIERIGTHQALLHGEDEQLGSSNRSGVGGLPADPLLEGSNRFAQCRRDPDFVGEP
jgi:hypothetical protein